MSDIIGDSEYLHGKLAECREECNRLEQAVGDLQAEERFLLGEWDAAEAREEALERELDRYALQIERENNFTQALKASADVVKKLERDFDAILEQTRAAERERCCKAVCEWCADDEPLRLIETQWLHSVDPFVEHWSWKYVRKCDAQAIREAAE